ncbi:MAG: gluconate 2-dehydrogenase subunit 3 family protein [Alphaproteobacteria bacterium]|nr:gluconate 2-dehydrogenase subunit 3 family protein [Alphaproteobacteria bacterium]
MSNADAPRALMSRRSLLRVGLVVGGLGAAGGVGRLAWLGAPAPGAALLTRRELEIIEAISELMFPEGNAIGVSWREVDLPLRVDALMTNTLAEAASVSFRYLLRALDLTSVFTHGTRFHAGTRAEQAEILTAWAEDFPQNLGVDAIKSVMAMAFFNHPRVLEAVGFQYRCPPGGPA